ncbi:MAG TPA: DivIVA domain-containing protein [Gaiellaceae bacterium]|jgi:DivIVA domain-containing protein|nr:DivIVA domain-containing protein [Gaiellaceae bacterium]
MRYTPVELRHVKLPKSLRGYKAAEVDKLLLDVADSFEEVWRERGELVDKLQDIEKMLADVKARETLLASTLVAAEKTAVEAVESAKREGELIVAEAHQEARAVTRSAAGERERLFAEARRVETLLRAALGMVEEARHEAEPTPLRSEHWPNRQDTRELPAIVEPPPIEEPPRITEPDPPAASRDDDEPWTTARDFAWG